MGASVLADASALVEALLINGTASARLAEANLQAQDLIYAELISVLRRRLVLAVRLPEQHALRALITTQRLGLRRHVSVGRPLPKGWDPSTGRKANLTYGK